jgi:hypothetical protein
MSWHLCSSLPDAMAKKERKSGKPMTFRHPMQTIFAMMAQWADPDSTSRAASVRSR